MHIRRSRTTARTLEKRTESSARRSRSREESIGSRTQHRSYQAPAASLPCSGEEHHIIAGVSLVGQEVCPREATQKHRIWPGCSVVSRELAARDCSSAGPGGWVFRRGAEEICRP